MNNLEGIKITEVKESKIEPTSMNIVNSGTTNNYDDCALTEREKLERLRANLAGINDYADCAKEAELVDDYSDCIKR